MSDLLAFVQLGFRHIVSLDAADHLLFLLVLAATYRLRDWRALVLAVSAFTVGHSVTLALAVTSVLVLPSDVIEFLIPLTIVATAIANLAALRSPAAVRPRIVLVGLFGLIHGAGFANYLRELFLQFIAVPLLGFNVGIELGQLAVLGVIWAGLAIIDRTAELLPQSGRWTPYRVRLVAISLVVVVVSTGWAAQRRPW
jgi:hypothetical protein